MLNMYRDEVILAVWLRDRIGMNAPQIEAEIIRLRENPTYDEYIRCNRKGATFALNRKMRKEIYGLSVQAIRHAAIEKEMKEAGAL
jgi:hypothetical protein